MSASLNKVTLIGNLGRDPESKGKGETPIALLTIATSREWKDRVTGKRREETEWHRVVAYQALAKIVLDYATKGRQVYIEGFLRTRKWTDAQGQDHYATEIIAEEVKLLGSNPHHAPQATATSTAETAKPVAVKQVAAEPAAAVAAAPLVSTASEPARVEIPAQPGVASTATNPHPIVAPAASIAAKPALSQAGLLEEDNDIPF